MEGIEKTQFLANYEFITVSDIVKQAVTMEAQFIEETTINKIDRNQQLTSGFRDLDLAIHSFKPKELTTIAVRPGKGKTAFLLSLIHNIALVDKKKIAVFSPERSAIKLVQRLIESETSNSAERIYSGTYKEADKEKVENLIKQCVESNIYIDDSTSLTVNDLSDRCKYLVDTHGVDLILFDNLELYSKNILDSDVNYSEQESIMQKINGLSKSIDVPIIVLSHTTNTHNMNELNDRPTIENVAPYISANSDLVIFVHRPNTININKAEYVDWKGCAELILAKHSNVTTPVSVKIKFIESSDRFTDL